MSGPRILFVVLAGVGLMLWWALVGTKDADLARGMEETELAFGALETELRELDEVYVPLLERGFMLSLRGQRDRLVTGLASLQARRLEIQSDPTLGHRERLPTLRSLVIESDELLAVAKALHARVKARYEFMTTSSPLLKTARCLRDALDAAPVENEVFRIRRTSLGGTFADLEQQAKTADQLLSKNISQGQVMGQATLNGLRELVDLQRALATEMGLAPPC